MQRNSYRKKLRGIVEPHFRYCCSVWGGCGETRLRALQKLQNQAARIVSNSSYDTSASLLIKNLKWLTVTDMIKSKSDYSLSSRTNSIEQFNFPFLFDRTI